MKRNWIISIGTALALLLSVMIPGFAVEGELPEEPETTMPRLTIVGTGIKNTEFFEVSLLVRADQFQTAGVVLSYDTAVLRPVDWTEAAAQLQVGNSWSSANAAIPSIGTDVQKEGAVRSVSGKPALAYEVNDELEPDHGRGYLYLGADALRYADLDDERVVTVRFQYAEGKNFDDVSMPVSAARSSDSLALCLAPADVAREAIPHARALLTTGNTDGITLDCYTYAEDITEGSGDKACEVVFQKIPDGKSVSTGTGAGGGYAITFFDWDGRVIDAITVEPGSAETSVRDWESKNQGRLTNKAGYAFDEWLVVQENNDGKGLVTAHETFTSNDAKLPAANEDLAKWADLFPEGKTSVFLQAAYYATEDINTGISDATASNYTVTPIAYTRYGGATADDGKYSITLEVRRENKAGKGVTRARMPGVVVKMQPTAGGNAIFTLLSLENTDVTTCEVVPNKQISSVEYYFIDSATAPRGSWPDAGNRSPLNVTISQNGDNGFKVLGTVGYINQMAREMTLAEFQNAVNHQTFLDAGLNYSAVGIAKAQTRMYNAVRSSVTDLNKTQLQAAIGNSSYD